MLIRKITIIATALLLCAALRPFPVVAGLVIGANGADGGGGSNTRSVRRVRWLGSFRRCQYVIPGKCDRRQRRAGRPRLGQRVTQ